jgi:hypothetical protein
MMHVPRSRTARLLAAAAAAAGGAAFAVFAMIGAPTAIAEPSDLMCTNGEVAMDGTCVPADNTAASLEVPQGSVNDMVPSSDSSPGSFDDVGAPSEAYLSERGY